MLVPRRWLWLCGSLVLLAAGHTLSPATREIARIRHHLAGAEAMLRSRDLSGLSAAQREARARRIADLQMYRRGGVFPHNHWVPGRRTPVFVDGHGTRCAMAHLIERSGSAALVARIARTRNLARIRDLACVPELAAWLDENGLTFAEAARIQPMYDPTPDESHSAQWAAAAASAAAGTTGIALNTSVATTQQARNSRGLTGVGLGLLGVVLSIPALVEGDGGLRTMGLVDLALGVTSVGLGMRSIEARGLDERLASATSVTPAAWWDGDGTRRLALVVRF